MINRDPNLLNVFDLRRVYHLPPHFEKVIVKKHISEKQLSDWIYENLHGRFYIGDVDVRENEDNKKSITRYTVVAFEEASEASYFSLFVDKIQ